MLGRNRVVRFAILALCAVEVLLLVIHNALADSAAKRSLDLVQIALALVVVVMIVIAMGKTGSSTKE